MTEWANNHAGLSSADTLSRLVAIQKNPAVLEHADELRAVLLDFIADFANWDNSSDRHFLRVARELTAVAHRELCIEETGQSRPVVIDPFAGGGAIPLEVARVGGEAFASDLNPVAVLLNKVLLEYIPEFGEELAAELRRCASTIGHRASERIEEFYDSGSEQLQVVGYLWARTILSESPDESGDAPMELPLLRSMWIRRKRGREVALRWRTNSSGEIQTVTASVEYADGTERKVRRPIIDIFEPTSASEVPDGTSRGGAATCPSSGFTTPVERVREQLKKRAGGASDSRMLCVITTPVVGSGKSYRAPTDMDIEIENSARRLLSKIVDEWPYDLQPIPVERLNHLRGFFNVVLYGMESWGQVFSPRQLLALLTFLDLIKQAGAEIENVKLRTAVKTCLALALGRLADKCASLVVWNISREQIAHVFGRQALPMVWDFAEANPFASIGWTGAIGWITKVIDANVKADLSVGTAVRASADQHVLPDDSADAIFTDPPYYAAIPYADLSDFFYVWLRRAVGDIHSGLFSTDLTPKSEEMVSLSHRAAMYREKNAEWFEQKMSLACAEGRRIVKPSGVGVFVFANKETEGWEAMLAALINSGWVVTASWPIDTEMATRLRARNSAVLASSVHLVCRPRENQDGSVRTDKIGDWREVLAQLPHRIHAWMPRLSEEGVVGADAIFACLGPALEIFSRYSRVEKTDGTRVELRDYLEHVWAAVSKEALNMVFEGGDATGFEEDARLTAIWLWTLSTGQSVADSQRGDGQTVASTGYSLDYDAARKIAQGLGVHMEEQPSLVEIKGGNARLFSVAERTRHLFSKEELDDGQKRSELKSTQTDLFAEIQDTNTESVWGASGTPILSDTTLDRVHQGMILFAAGRGEALKQLFVNEGAGNDPRIWSLAQALSALYPPTTDEKRWVDGLLARKKGLTCILHE